MPVKTVDPIIQRLESLARRTPELKNAAQVYAVLLPLLRAGDLHVATVPLDKEQAREQLQLGLPLLNGLDLDLDYIAAGELMIQLARALERARIPAARPIRRALEQGKVEMRVLLPRVAVGDGDNVSALAKSLELDARLLWTIAQNALKPALRAWCSQLNALVDGVDWRRGYCPICGATAILGELQGNEQAKHLRCGQCGADWPYLRLQCIYCGNEDHRTLGYLYPEGTHDTRRIEICDRCKGYLKVIAAFSPTPVELLPVEDLATLPLDYVAQERGYRKVVADGAVGGGKQPQHN